jgi:hypothetical protein
MKYCLYLLLFIWGLAFINGMRIGYLKHKKLALPTQAT